ncbi:MAG: hypothetical protein IJ838_00250 [Paludibacteraceae bacterium]|nr:hypothetical protein [Paludibacteraceae bacterium]
MEKQSINRRFIASVNWIIDNGLARNKGELAELLGIKPAKFSEILNDRMNAGTDLIATVCALYPDISPDWLLNNKGDMIRDIHTLPYDKPSAQLLETKPVNNPRNLPAIDAKLIPLVTPTAVAGFGNGTFAIQEADIKEYYVVPKFKYNRVDFMIEISGSSMYPKYNSGDVVACTILHDNSFIQWNKCHVIATREQGLLCKRLMQSDTTDALRLVSDNPNYPPFDVPKSEITGIALVIGVIRLE